MSWDKRADLSGLGGSAFVSKGQSCYSARRTVVHNTCPVGAQVRSDQGTGDSERQTLSLKEARDVPGGWPGT